MAAGQPESNVAESGATKARPRLRAGYATYRTRAVEDCSGFGACLKLVFDVRGTG